MLDVILEGLMSFLETIFKRRRNKNKKSINKKDS